MLPRMQPAVMVCLGRLGRATSRVPHLTRGENSLAPIMAWNFKASDADVALVPEDTVTLNYSDKDAA